MMESRYHTRTLLRIGGSLVLAALIAGCNASGAPEGAEITTSGAGATTYNQPGNTSSTGYSATAPNGYGAPYKVVPGDTVYGVAQRLNVPVRALIDANGLKPPYRLAPGQQLAMPGGGTYDPDLAVTTPAPSATYGSGGTGGDTDGTYAGSASGSAPRVITSTGSIAMEDLSPAAGGSTTATPPPAAAGTAAIPPVEGEPTNTDVAVVPTVKPAAPSTATTAPAPSASTMPPPSEVATIPDATTTDGQFQWPLQGKVISRFGAKIGGQHNDGINIAAHAGDKVLAADGGVVAYSGNELKGFGNLLLIRHANGWITAYAHNQKLLVNKGDKVKRGQPIATVGATGNVESPQLHFEIRRGSDPVDPLQHLASRG